MIYYSVSVIDRQTKEEVVVGSMLETFEAAELIRILEKYNSTDLQIVRNRESWSK